MSAGPDTFAAVGRAGCTQGVGLLVEHVGQRAGLSPHLGRRRCRDVLHSDILETLVSALYIYINIYNADTILLDMRLPHHAVARRRGGRRGRDWDGHAQSFDHGQDVFRHVGGVVALVLPAAQL